MMMFSNATRSSSYFIVVLRNLRTFVDETNKFEMRFGRIRDETNMLAVEKLMPECLLNLRVSSKCSTSWARSRLRMLLISAAYAEFLPDMFL